jgi:hypothetical protein
VDFPRAARKIRTQMAGLTRWLVSLADSACGSKELADLLCSDFGAERQNPSTIIEKYRSAEG